MFFNLSPLFSVLTDADFGSFVEITFNSGRTACIDFTDLVVDDDIALEGNEAFTIKVGRSNAMVTIIDDDGEPNSKYYMMCRVGSPNFCGSW